MTSTGLAEALAIEAGGEMRGTRESSGRSFHKQVRFRG